MYPNNVVKSNIILPINKHRNKEKVIYQNNKFLVKLRAHFIYCLRVCTAHGFIHIVRKNSRFEKLLWVFLLVVACIPCILLGGEAWSHFTDHPTVISLERDHWNWETAFPTITICPNNILDDQLELVRNEINKTHLMDDEDELLPFLRELFFGNYKTYANLKQYKKKFDFINPNDYLKYNHMVISLGEMASTIMTFPGSKTFQKVTTELGVCHVFNSEIDIYSTLEYWENNTFDIIGIDPIQTYNRAMGSPHIIAADMDTNFTVYYHGPNEIIDIKTKGIPTADGTYSVYHVSTQSVITSDDVKQLSVQQRKCRFTEESNLKHSPIYSYVLCKVECRIKLCLKYCNCLPYYYRKLNNEKTCDLDGMICLSKVADHLYNVMEVNTNVPCECIQNCNTDQIIIWALDLKIWFAGTHLQTIVSNAPEVRYKRTIIFTQTDLLVQIGSITGLCLGISILSLIELIYFLTLRFFWGVVKDKTI